MHPQVRRLLSIEEYTFASPLSIADCRDRLASRLVPLQECHWRSGSILDDGSPLCFGEVAGDRFTLGHCRGWIGSRGEFARSTGRFEAGPSGTLVHLHINALWTRRMGLGLVWLLVACPVLVGLSILSRAPVGALASLLGLCLAGVALVTLLWRDDPDTVRRLVHQAVMGTQLAESMTAPKTSI